MKLNKTYPNRMLNQINLGLRHIKSNFGIVLKDGSNLQ